MNKLAVIILNFNGSEDTLACLNSIERYEQDKNYFYYVFDNGSSIESFRFLESRMIECGYINRSQDFEAINCCNENEKFHLIRSEENYGFAKGNNLCIDIAKKNGCNLFLLMNNDTELIENSITRLYNAFYENNKYEAMSTVINYWSNPQKVWNAGGKLLYGTRKYYSNYDVDKWKQKGLSIVEVEFLTGCFLMVRENAFENGRLLTEKFFFGEEDYELALRFKRNKFKAGVLTETVILHKVGRSIETSNLKKDISKSFIHHLNRLINMKTYYSRGYWFIWEKISLLYFLKLIYSKGCKFSDTITYIQNLHEFAIRYNAVDKKMFEQILSSDMLKNNIDVGSK